MGASCRRGAHGTLREWCGEINNAARRRGGARGRPRGIEPGAQPATFSGGEQQRVNIARSFAAWRPVLLLDEPTASLDAESRARVVELIAERRDAGAAILGIFHDQAVRTDVADRTVDVERFAAG